MKKLLFVFGCGYLLLFFQTFPFFSFGKTGVTPEILIMIVLFSSLSLPYFKGFLVCFILGYCCELLSGCNNGLYITTYISVFAALKFFQKYIVFNNYFHYLGMLIFSLLLKMGLFLLLSYFFYDTYSDHLLFCFWEEFFYSIIVCSIVFLLFKFSFYNNNFVHEILADDINQV